MPFENGTFTAALFSLPQDLPENYMDLLNAGRAGDVDLVKDEPEIGWTSRPVPAGFENRAADGFVEQPGLRLLAESGAESAVLHAQSVVSAGRAGLDACQRA